MHEAEMKLIEENIYMTENKVEDKIQMDNIDGELFSVCQVSP